MSNINLKIVQQTRLPGTITNTNMKKNIVIFIIAFKIVRVSNTFF